MSDEEKKDKKHLSLVDLTEVIEEEKKLPAEIIASFEALTAAAKAGQLKSAILFYELNLPEEQEAEKQDDSFLFFFHEDSSLAELNFTAEYIKNYIYQLCLANRDSEHDHDGH